MARDDYIAGGRRVIEGLLRLFPPGHPARAKVLSLLRENVGFTTYFPAGALPDEDVEAARALLWQGRSEAEAVAALCERRGLSESTARRRVNAAREVDTTTESES